MMHGAIDNDPNGDEADSQNFALNHSNNRRNKRFQACIACRATKTKCLPSEHSDTCQSCLKASRPCVMPGPAKPRMKSAQKFSELEKKIEMLTNALAGKEQRPSGALDTGGTQPDRGNLQTPTTSNEDSSPVEQVSSAAVRSTDYINPLSPDMMNPEKHQQLDVVDDGSIGRETATNLFIHWNTNMRCFIPLLFFQQEIEAEQIRKERPTLFLAILTVASSSICPSLSAQLVSRLTSELARQIFVRSTQNIDIILATLLFSQYYFQPGGSTTLAPSQYIYTAIAMVSDLGLHAQAKGFLKSGNGLANEAARVCLSEWYAASTTAVTLHRNTFVRFTPDIEKYATSLLRDHHLSDDWLFSLIKLQQIIESATLLLDVSENKSESAFDEQSTQYKINMLQQQLDTWYDNAPENVDSRLKELGKHKGYLNIYSIAVRCYVRKLAIQKQSGVNPTQKHDDGLMGLSPSHFDCLTKCLSSVKASFDLYLSLEAPLARCLPNHYLFWNISTAVMLIKLGHFGEVLTKLKRNAPQRGQSTPISAFQDVVVYYLDSIASKMESLIHDGYMPQAKPCITVLRKLKPYYLQKRNICINPQGDAVLVHTDEAPTVSTSHNKNRTGVSGSGLSSPLSGEINRHSHDAAMIHPYGMSPHQQAQSSSGSFSHSGWTPVSQFSPTIQRSPSFSETYRESLGSPSLNVTAAYDPYTYANTDWTSLTLDPDAIQQLDSFMFAEEDTAWMQSLL